MIMILFQFIKLAFFIKICYNVYTFEEVSSNRGFWFMLGKKEKSVLLLLDIIASIFNVVAIVLFTLVFRLETSYVRYLFLLGDCYVIYSFSKTLSPSIL